jgi:hypothetical protein
MSSIPEWTTVFLEERGERLLDTSLFLGLMETGRSRFLLGRFPPALHLVHTEAALLRNRSRITSGFVSIQGQAS